LDAALVRSKWLDQVSGRGNWRTGTLLWSVCIFQSWLQQLAGANCPPLPLQDGDLAAGRACSSATVTA
jgi:hypothetical protein